MKALTLETQVTPVQITFNYVNDCEQNGWTVKGFKMSHEDMILFLELQGFEVNRKKSSLDFVSDTLSMLESLDEAEFEQVFNDFIFFDDADKLFHRNLVNMMQAVDNERRNPGLN